MLFFCRPFSRFDVLFATSSVSLLVSCLKKCEVWCFVCNSTVSLFVGCLKKCEVCIYILCPFVACPNNFAVLSAHPNKFLCGYPCAAHNHPTCYVNFSCLSPNFLFVCVFFLFYCFFLCAFVPRFEVCICSVWLFSAFLFFNPFCLTDHWLSHAWTSSLSLYITCPIF